MLNCYQKDYNQKNLQQGPKQEVAQLMYRGHLKEVLCVYKPRPSKAPLPALTFCASFSQYPFFKLFLHLISISLQNHLWTPPKSEYSPPAPMQALSLLLRHHMMSTPIFQITWSSGLPHHIKTVIQKPNEENSLSFYTMNGWHSNETEEGPSRANN